MNVSNTSQEIVGGQHNIGTKMQYVTSSQKVIFGVFISKTETFSNRTINYTCLSDKFFIYIIMQAKRFCYIFIVFRYDRNM